MKKDELLAIGLTEEQAAQVFAMNGKDVEKVKGDVSSLKNQLAEAQSTISTLEANKGDMETLQAELDKYKQAEAQRQQAEKEAAARAAKVERFTSAKGDKQFSSKYAENGVLEAFLGAVDDPANAGKSDAELFEAITGGETGLFRTETPPPFAAGAGSHQVGGTEKPGTFRDAIHEQLFPQKG